jgi:hypothetical protein
VVHNGGNTAEVPARLLSLIKEKAGEEAVCLLPCSCPFGERNFSQSLAGATHIVMIAPPAIEALPWMVFTAGFCKGSGKILIVYGNSKNFKDYPLFNGLPFVASELELTGFFDREYDPWLNAERKQKARQAILDMNLPFTEASFADCIIRGGEDAVPLFLEAGFSSNAKNENGVPLLCLAVRGGYGEIAGRLIGAGADVNLRAEDRGASALVDAAMGKQSKIMELLIRAGADVNVKSSDGQSALILSVGLDDIASAELLLKAGADPDAADSLGASARKYVLLFKKAPMLSLFEQYAPAKP